MADLPPYSGAHRDTDEDSGAESSRGSTTGAPRWVKATGVIAVVLVVVVGVMLLTGGGSHGPGRHTGGQPPSSVTPSGGGAGGPSPSGVRPPGGAGGHRSPAGGHAPRS